MSHSVVPPAPRPEPPPASADGGAAARLPARLVRIPEGRWLGGVCTGLAAHLGWPVLVVRIMFVALGLEMVGVVIYALLWLMRPLAGRDPVPAQPGLASATRSGLRTPQDTPEPAQRRADMGPAIALIVFAFGLFALLQLVGLGISGKILWPIMFAGVGVALIWRQADAGTPPEGRARLHDRSWLGRLAVPGRLASILRLILGVGLIGASFALVLASRISLQALPEALLMTFLGIAGIGVVAAPWLFRVRTSLQQAREEKVRADARADMAAHLHDSVLQTLALIQRRADDPKTVQSLARRQERELRTWLYGDIPDEATLKAALTRAAAEIEDERGVEIELVVVGDLEMTPDLTAMVRAAREAMMNAAKHSGAELIDVYAEVGDALVEIFVRDRGRGFDPDSIDHDRMGVRRSIIERMKRHGGTARIRSAPGEGTEVRLEWTR
ncbi:ATP-binding protein [Enemella sp. A6]|uniref:ATP-binding protein n=1 Tax=Enemella sp. A6 TaxID=3440152 RepID=UPI003EBE880A